MNQNSTNQNLEAQGLSIEQQRVELASRLRELKEHIASYELCCLSDTEIEQLFADPNIQLILEAIRLIETIL